MLTGAVVGIGGAMIDAGVEPAKDGWFRFWGEFSASTGAAASAMVVYLQNYGPATEAMTVALWGGQLEAGDTISSTILTGAAAVTRAADVLGASMLSSVPEADGDAYSATKMYVQGDRVMVTTTTDHSIYESLVGKYLAAGIPAQNPLNVPWPAHGLAAGTPVQFTPQVGSTMPTGLTAGTTYYVRATGMTADTFQIETVLNGTSGSVATSSASTGLIDIKASTNLGKSPADGANPTQWLKVGATNRWAMFDNVVGSQTEGTEHITAAVKLAARVDSVAFVNLNSTAVRVRLYDLNGTVAYDRLVSTQSTAGIDNAYSYFFEPITRIADLVLDDLPPYASGILSLSAVSAPGQAVAVGGALLGQQFEIGATEVGVRVGTQDYSIKQRDSFGRYQIVQRAFNKRANYTVAVESSLVDKLQDTLAAYRAVPIVFIGSSAYGATIVYGFYKSFEIEIGYADGTSVCTLEVEGLT